MNMILIVTIALSKPWRPPWSERGTASILYYTILYILQPHSVHPRKLKVATKTSIYILLNNNNTTLILTLTLILIIMLLLLHRM